MTKQRRTPPSPDLLSRLLSDFMLAGRLVFDRRVSGKVKLIPLAMLLYIISPFDLIPDLFLPLGIVDDLSALLVGLQLFIRSAPPDVVQAYRAGKRRNPLDDPPRKNNNAQIIEGEYAVRDAPPDED